MKVLFDIVHPADVNVFSYVINRLISQGHNVTCSVLNRGRLPQIVKKEFPKTNIVILGKHQRGVVRKFLGIVFRELSFLRFYINNKFDVVVGFGFYAGVLAWIRGAKSINMHDDKEYKGMFLTSKFFCNKFISFVPTSGKKVVLVNGFKELAYLSSKYVSFDDSVLKKLNLKPKKYVYVREIANISYNYADSKRIDYTKTFDWLRNQGFTILLDAEGEHSYDHVQKISGVFSLPEHNSIKNNAALIITSGDTVLREGALMGIPTIYTSDRVMKINESLLNNDLFSIAKTSDDLLSLSSSLIGKKKSSKFSKFINSCDDSNKILYEEIFK